MSSNAIPNFSLWWHKLNIFSSSASCRTNFRHGMYPTPCMSPDNLWSSARISIIGGWSLIIYYKHMHLIIHFNPGATQLFLQNFFLSLLFNILTEMPVASSSVDVWQQHITSSIARLHFKNSFSNMFKMFESSQPCPCMAHPLSLAFQVTTSRDGILLNTLQPTFCIMSTKLFATKTCGSKPLCMICWRAHVPSSRATKLAHGFSTPTKITEDGHTASCCIFWNSSSAFCP